MNSLRRFSLTAGFIGVLFGWLGNATPIFACSCAMATPSEQFDNATTIFVGTVKSISADGWDNIVAFDVHESRKGSSVENVSVTTSQQGASCGFDFEEGEKYIVYAYDDDGALGTGMCSGTSLFAANTLNGDVAVDIASSFVEPIVEEKKSENSIVPTIITIILSFAAGVFVMHVVGRRKRTG